MGNVAGKLAYTYKSVKDIRNALEERGKNALSSPLNKLGDMIRSLPIASSKILITVDKEVIPNKPASLGFNTFESHSFQMPRLVSYSTITYDVTVLKE